MHRQEKRACLEHRNGKILLQIMFHTFKKREWTHSTTTSSRTRDHQSEMSLSKSPNASNWHPPWTTKSWEGKLNTTWGDLCVAALNEIGECQTTTIYQTKHKKATGINQQGAISIFRENEKIPKEGRAHFYTLSSSVYVSHVWSPKPQPASQPDRWCKGVPIPTPNHQPLLFQPEPFLIAGAWNGKHRRLKLTRTTLSNVNTRKNDNGGKNRNKKTKQ